MTVTIYGGQFMLAYQKMRIANVEFMERRKSLAL